MGGLLLLPLRPPPTNAQTVLDIAALMARLAAVPERRATFREEKRIAALSVPLQSSGTLLYRRPGRLEKLTDWPERESLVVEGDRVILTESNEPPRVVPLSADPGLRALVDAFRAPLAGDLPALERSFRVRGSGSPAAWQIDLTPNDAAVARFLSAVHLEGVGDALRAVDIVQTNGDRQHIAIGPP